MHSTPVYRYLGRTLGLVGLLSAFFWVGLFWGGFGATPASEGTQTFFERPKGAIPFVIVWAGTAAFGDYTNDGWPDLFVMAPSWTTGVTLFHNEGGRFVDRTTVIQTDMFRTGKNGVAFADYDNDGDLDLFIANVYFLKGGWSPNTLLQNDRGVFTDVTLKARLTDAFPSWNAIWLDYDRDGYLDLYVGNTEDPFTVDGPEAAMWNTLHRNNGDGTFTDVTEEAGLDIQLHPQVGGSNGGMAAGDFNDDGWPDLYVGVWKAPNRLFLNDREGGFRDATTSEIGDPGTAGGVAVGDIDNDGDLDIFQAAGTGWEDYRSVMLLNLGEGQFLDVTPGVGLSALRTEGTAGARLEDVDNDGDLDLITAWPHFLYLNNGDGTFLDATSQSGMGVDSFPLLLGDVDLDGFLDVWGWNKLYRNTGNDNHWLRVELVGIASNRNGIGARLIATSGELTQMREILGGTGFAQDEMVAHFGLGAHTRVDRLEVRWPSGQVDVLESIPADQKIRVFEGRTGIHVVQPTTGVWTDPLPDTLVVGSTVTLDATLTIRTGLFEPGAEIARVTADLSELGGASHVLLPEGGEHRYHLEHVFTVVGPTGLKYVSVLIEQETSLGLYWTKLDKSVFVMVVASEDMVIYEDGVAEGWSVEVRSPAESDLMSSAFAHSGSVSHAILPAPGLLPGTVQYVFDDPEGIDPVGYTYLEFYINGGASSEQDILISGRRLRDFRVVPESDTWTLVRIPMSEVPLNEEGHLTSIVFGGMVKDTFYIDDMKLVVGGRKETAVEVSEGNARPSGYGLSQNVPNPFNPITTIAYDLPQPSDVTLTLYTLTGQKVSTLVSEHQEPGHYEVIWDGSGFGHGIYFYRLEAGEFAEARRMVLVK